MSGLTAFDDGVDRVLERFRGRRAIDRTMVAASELGDFALVWHIVGVTRGLTSDQRATQALAFAALLGIESLLVNQGIKRIFRRRRPTASGDVRLTVRTPSTSSFPSGHASSAFFAATVLTAWDGAAVAPLYFAIAVVVALSRAYVRIHHASDVVGGAAVGTALAALALWAPSPWW